MSKRTPPWLDDMSQLARRAGKLAVAARAEGERGWKAAVLELLDELPLVQRDEFEVLRALVLAADERQAALEKRIAVLEKAAAAKRQAQTKATTKSKSKTRRKTG